MAHSTGDAQTKVGMRILLPTPLPLKSHTIEKSSTKLAQPLGVLMQGIPMQKSSVNFARKVMSFTKPEPRLIDVKSIVNKHHQVIVRNIVPSEELFSALEAYGVLAETMVQDVRDSETREESVYKILDLVSMKGKKAMVAFCDALQHSGHAFIADFLRDEIRTLEKEIKTTSQPRQEVPHRDDPFDNMTIIKYLCGKFERALHEREKDELTAYLDRKFQSAVVKMMYKKNIDDKEKAIAAKQQQMEEQWRYNEMLDEKEDVIKALRDKLEEAFVELGKKGVRMSDMKQYVRDLERKHEKVVNGQMKFNEANDSSLRRLHQRVETQNKVFKDMIVMMEPYMPEPNEYRVKRYSFASLSTDYISTDSDLCKWSLKRMLLRTADLASISEKYTVLVDEKNFVIAQLCQGMKKREGKPPTLREALKEFVASKDSQIEKWTKEANEFKKQLAEAVDKHTHAQEKVKALEIRNAHTKKDTQNTYVNELFDKDDEIMALKSTRDDLLDQHALKDRTIMQMEMELTALRQMLDLNEDPDLGGGGNKSKLSQKQKEKQYADLRKSIREGNMTELHLFRGKDSMNPGSSVKQTRKNYADPAHLNAKELPPLYQGGGQKPRGSVMNPKKGHSKSGHDGGSPPPEVQFQQPKVEYYSGGKDQAGRHRTTAVPLLEVVSSLQLLDQALTVVDNG